MTRRLLSLLLLGAATPALAQTAIVPDTAAAATTGTTATAAGNVTVIDGGARVGNNLFHSFNSFTLATGDIARWARAANDGATIAHIVNRVTGGTASSIDGTLTTQGMPNAQFWFVNPAGIVFGANAQVAVPNAAHFSTAGVLRLADGGSFAVATPGGSVLTVAAPNAFGFLGTQGSISVTGAQPAFIGANSHLALSAANIAISDATFTAGSLDFSAVGTGIGNVAVADPTATRFGNGRITVTDSFVTAEPGPVGSGAVRAMASRLDVAGSIFSSDSNDRTAAGFSLLVGDLRVVASPTAGAPQTYLGTFASGRGNAGALNIRAETILLSGSSSISTQALPTAIGNAGNIAIDTGTLTVETGATILSSAFGNSATGQIRINATAISLFSNGSIESTTYGRGQGGNIVLRTGTLTVDNGRIAAEAEINSTGDAGAIDIAVTGALTVSEAGIVTSTSLGGGLAGRIDVTADTIALRTGGGIESNSDGEVGAGAGDIRLTARLIQISSFRGVSSTTTGAGNGGNVFVRASDLSLNAGRIVSEAGTGASGDAGAIDVRVTGALTLDNESIISTSSFGSGLAGLVSVSADTIALRQRSSIESNSFGPDTIGVGEVEIVARSLRLESGSEVSSRTSGAGSGGFVDIRVGRVALDGGTITTETTASGRAGDVNIVATDIVLTNGGRIVSEQAGPGATGDAGRIKIATETLAIAPSTATAISTSIQNTGQAGEIDITAKSILLDGAEIGSAANGRNGGVSGFVDIRADRIDIVNGGRIETSSFGPGSAGGISVVAKALSVRGSGSKITSENLSARGGLAGSIFVSADSVQLLDGAGISTDSRAGAAGDITVLMPETSTLLLRARSGSASFITTSSGPGTGGIITIASPYLILSDGGSILAKGQAFGADVLIQSNFYIRSADRANQLSVDGGLIVDSEVGDLSTGSESVNLSFLDASSVLRGQCAAARSGGVSQFDARIIGPYVPIARQASPNLIISSAPVRTARCG